MKLISTQIFTKISVQNIMFLIYPQGLNVHAWELWLIKACKRYKKKITQTVINIEILIKTLSNSVVK